MSNMNILFLPSQPARPRSDYDAASSTAGKVENEVKRLHTLIVDINSHKLKAQQDKLDTVNRGLDDCSSTITKARVAIKTADRWGRFYARCSCAFELFKHFRLNYIKPLRRKTAVALMYLNSARTSLRHENIYEVGVQIPF